MEDFGLNFVYRRGKKSQSKAAHNVFPRMRPTSCTCTNCLKCIKDWLPLESKREMIQLVKLAGPVIISQLMVFLINFVSIVFCGHLGETELAGVSLAISIIIVTGISVGMGLSSAFDTLISQTYGSGNLKRVGVILQRGVLILLLACFPCWAILLNTENMLLAVKQNPEVARHSQMYVNIFMPALPAAFMYQLQGRYLQNQGIIWPQVITGAIGNVLNAFVNYILLYVLDLGVVGSAAANSISQIASALILFIYIYWKGLHKATWSGWSKDCLQEWGLFTKVAIPSMLMLCLEWWTFEIGGLLAGLISEIELGAQSIVYQMVTIVFMVPMGFMVAASVRVGNALGAGNIEQAKTSGKVAVILAFAISVIFGLVLGLCKNVVGYIFTTEKEIIQRVSEVMIIYGVFHSVDAVAAVTGGVIRGAGKPMVGALCNLVGYYFIGIPIGVSLMFAAKMGIMGLWLGLSLCVTIQAAFYIFYLYKLDWKKVAEEAMVRAGVPVQDMENEGHARSPVTESQVNIISSNSLSNEEFNSDLLTPGQDGTAGAAGPRPLSFWQLVVRRGLTVVLMVLILIVGIIASEMLPKLLK
ncbi:multidrug and toxin extrusion protein 1-like [Sebastes fasciatus]|uniref:multidrug and toxin extrusion protein 1-like n=1 Tax=Sebastes fasciatus TaxID=394691 RepID=UPI003D9E9B30